VSLGNLDLCRSLDRQDVIKAEFWLSVVTSPVIHNTAPLSCLLRKIWKICAFIGFLTLPLAIAAFII